MNTPSPLIPQGSLERQSQGKSTVRIAIFTIVSIHAVFFAGLLMQGCRHDDNQAGVKSAEAATNQNSLPQIDPGYYPSAQDVPSGVTAAAPAPSAPFPALTDVPSPLPPASTIAELPPDTKPYTIAKGDNLAKIAKANGITVAALSRANPSVEASKLRPGQKIQIPPASPNSAPGLGYSEPARTENVTTAGNTHSVRAGESLTRIAKQHGITVRAIRAANNLKTDRLFVGQKLKLPSGQPAATGSSAKSSTVSKLTATNMH